MDAFGQQLIRAYTEKCIAEANKHLTNPPKLPPNPLLSTIISQCEELERYKDPIALEKALDAIDLGKIYSQVDQRQKDPTEVCNGLAYQDLGYEDLVVRETLRYFKEHFFSWMDKPKCPKCTNNDKVAHVETTRVDRPGPDGVTYVEQYTCQQCGSSVAFPRINNPVSLLSSRTGRCGEWANCFMLILHALVPGLNRLRTVWNAEDHVWCEYYSTHLGRWIHLDPCEDSFDNPHLYAVNWGKKMSLVIGISDGYVVDLSKKYITPDKQIEGRYSTQGLQALLKHINYSKLKKAASNDWMQIYTEIIVRKNSEKKEKRGIASGEKVGRASGNEEWKRQRGEI